MICKPPPPEAIVVWKRPEIRADLACRDGEHTIWLAGREWGVALCEDEWCDGVRASRTTLMGMALSCVLQDLMETVERLYADDRLEAP